MPESTNRPALPGGMSQSTGRRREDVDAAADVESRRPGARHFRRSSPPRFAGQLQGCGRPLPPRGYTRARFLVQ